MQKILFIDYEKCTGCRSCEMYCSFEKTKTCNPVMSRVKVIKWEQEGIVAPTTCMQCDDAPCMSVCPVKAIMKEPESGMIAIDLEMCIGCKMCLMICPFGAISRDPIKGKVFRCDLCDGDPMCAKVCRTQAISFLPAETGVLIKRRQGIEKVANIARWASSRLEGGK